MDWRGKLMAALTRHRLAVYILTNLVALAGALGLLIGKTSNTLHSIGEGLAAAAFTGGLLTLYTWLELKDDEERERMAQARVTGVYSERAPDGYDFSASVASARHHVDILAFGLRNFRERIYPDPPWPQEAAVRILLADPAFPSEEHSYARQRALEEQTALEQNGIDARLFVRSARPSILAAQEAADGEDAGDPTFEVKLFKCLPTLTLFRVDNVLLWGPYLTGQANQTCPLIQVEEGGFLFAAILEHFDRIWTDPARSTVVPDEWLADPAEAQN